MRTPLPLLLRLSVSTTKRNRGYYYTPTLAYRMVNRIVEKVKGATKIKGVKKAVIEMEVGTC